MHAFTIPVPGAQVNPSYIPIFPPPRDAATIAGMRAIGRSNAEFWIVMAVVAVCAVIVAIDPTLALLLQILNVALIGFALWLCVGLFRREKWAIFVTGLVGVAVVLLLLGFAAWLYLMTISGGGG